MQGGGKLKDQEEEDDDGKHSLSVCGVLPIFLLDLLEFMKDKALLYKACLQTTEGWQESDIANEYVNLARSSAIEWS